MLLNINKQIKLLINYDKQIILKSLKGGAGDSLPNNLESLLDIIENLDKSVNLNNILRLAIMRVIATLQEQLERIKKEEQRIKKELDAFVKSIKLEIEVIEMSSRMEAISNKFGSHKTQTLIEFLGEIKKNEYENFIIEYFKNNGPVFRKSIQDFIKHINLVGSIIFTLTRDVKDIEKKNLSGETISKKEEKKFEEAPEMFKLLNDKLDIIVKLGDIIITEKYNNILFVQFIIYALVKGFITFNGSLYLTIGGSTYDILSYLKMDKSVLNIFRLAFKNAKSNDKFNLSSLETFSSLPLDALEKIMNIKYDLNLELKTKLTELLMKLDTANADVKPQIVTKIIRLLDEPIINSESITDQPLIVETPTELSPSIELSPSTELSPRREPTGSPSASNESQINELEKKLKDIKKSILEIQHLNSIMTILNKPAMVLSALVNIHDDNSIQTFNTLSTRKGIITELEVDINNIKFYIIVDILSKYLNEYLDMSDDNRLVQLKIYNPLGNHPSDAEEIKSFENLQTMSGEAYLINIFGEETFEVIKQEIEKLYPEKQKKIPANKFKSKIEKFMKKWFKQLFEIIKNNFKKYIILIAIFKSDLYDLVSKLVQSNDKFDLSSLYDVSLDDLMKIAIGTREGKEAREFLGEKMTQKRIYIENIKKDLPMHELSLVKKQTELENKLESLKKK